MFRNTSSNYPHLQVYQSTLLGLSMFGNLGPPRRDGLFVSEGLSTYQGDGVSVSSLFALGSVDRQGGRNWSNELINERMNESINSQSLPPSSGSQRVLLRKKAEEGPRTAPPGAASVLASSSSSPAVLLSCFARS